MGTSGQGEAQRAAAEKRRIAVALLVALLLHTPLLLPPGTFLFGSLDESAAPMPEVRIELQNAQILQDEQRQPEQAPKEQPRLEEQQPEELVAQTSETIDAPETDDPAEVVDVPAEMETPGEVEEQLATNESDVQQQIIDAAAAEAVADTSDGDARVAENPDVTGDELGEIAEPLSPVDAVVATVAPSQEKMLTRRLTREAQELLESRDLTRNLSFEDGDREFNAKLTRQPATNGTDIERLTIEVTTLHGGELVRTSMQMKRLAFSHFTQLIDRWDPAIQLHDDEIGGRFHSNSEIVLAYDRKIAPKLLGKVTTTRGVKINADKWYRSQRDIFVGGLATRTARVRLPFFSVRLPSARSGADTDVYILRGDSQVVFYADGSYDTLELASDQGARRRLDPDRQTYIIGARDAELRVRGTITGSVTVYSPQSIVVQGNLTYAHDPRADRDADSYLGLVSDGNIEVAGPEVTGQGDLDIHAAIYARERFVVRSTASRRSGTMLIYGSLTAGSISETEPRYATRIEFDQRFERKRPPGFPETDRYEVEKWDERWRATEEPES